jgi:hypothetical protein
MIAYCRKGGTQGYEPNHRVDEEEEVPWQRRTGGSTEEFTCDRGWHSRSSHSSGDCWLDGQRPCPQFLQPPTWILAPQTGGSAEPTFGARYKPPSAKNPPLPPQKTWFHSLRLE